MRLLLYLSAIVCGSGYALTFFYPALAPITLAGTLALSCGVLSRRDSTLILLTAGLLAGAVYSFPVLYTLEFELIPTLLVLGWHMAFFSIYVLLLALAYPGMGRYKFSPLLAGLVCTLLDWAICESLSPWGRAFSFARIWAEYPIAIGFVRYTGVFGITALLFCLPAMLGGVLCIKHGRTFRGLLCCVFIVLGAIGSWLAYCVPFGEESVTAGVIGLDSQMVSEAKALAMAEGVASKIRQENATDKGLVVLPEYTFFLPVSPLKENQIVRKLQSIARTHHVSISTGVIWKKKNINLGISPEGILTTYQKTHLLGENLIPGDGTPGILLPLRAGLLICNDDNFMDVIARYVMQKAHPVRLLISPAADWSQIAQLHQQSARLRALESGLPLVRANSNGWSSIIDERGGVQATVLNLEPREPVVAIGQVLLSNGGSFNAQHPNWFVGFCGTLLVFLLLRGIIIRKRD